MSSHRRDYVSATNVPLPVPTALPPAAPLPFDAPLAAPLPSPLCISLIHNRLVKRQLLIGEQKVEALVRADARDRPAIAAPFDAEIARLEKEIQTEEERVGRIHHARPTLGNVWGTSNATEWSL